MKTKYIINFAIVVVVFATTCFGSTFAQAAELCYETGFERPTFVPGMLDTQDGWHNPQKTASILPVHPMSGDQSIRVFGNKLNDVGPGLVGTRFSRLFMYDASGKTVNVSVDAQLNGPSTATGPVPNPSNDLISANLDLLLADGLNQPIYLGALVLSSSGDVWVLDQDNNYMAFVQVNLDEYHHLAARIDFSKREIQFFVDNALVTILNIDPSITSNIFAVGAPGMFAVSDRKLLKHNLYKSYFDNYRVATDNC